MIVPAAGADEPVRALADDELVDEVANGGEGHAWAGYQGMDLSWDHAKASGGGVGENGEFRFVFELNARYEYEGETSNQTLCSESAQKQAWLQRTTWGASCEGSPSNIGTVGSLTYCAVSTVYLGHPNIIGVPPVTWEQVDQAVACHTIERRIL